jgi:hypothetical protein
MILTHLIDFREDPLVSLTGPRFLLGKTFSDSRDTLKLEVNAGDAVFAELAGRGHMLSPIDQLRPFPDKPVSLPGRRMVRLRALVIPVGTGSPFLRRRRDGSTGGTGAT